jgi:hypothetical protein
VHMLLVLGPRTVSGTLTSGSSRECPMPSYTNSPLGSIGHGPSAMIRIDDDSVTSCCAKKTLPRPPGWKNNPAPSVSNPCFAVSVPAA